MSASTRPLITVKWLKQKYACSSSVNTFNDTFPYGARFTRDNLRIAVAAGLSMFWLASKVLPEIEYEKFNRNSDEDVRLWHSSRRSWKWLNSRDARRLYRIWKESTHVT